MLRIALSTFGGGEESSDHYSVAGACVGVIRYLYSVVREVRRELRLFDTKNFISSVLPMAISHDCVKVAIGMFNSIFSILVK